ncbi:uncharacterized protein LOC135472190 [Liolophura sinensis]|uniref:uncharacterized protein LOC135472190 n=1 Tax=Liolophura sinensis TaxID=3198878 RepID=UPI0031588623
MGMMMRDWVLLRGTRSTDLVDAIHSVVYNSITPVREAYNVLIDSKTHMHLVPIALSCKTNNSQQYCQEDLFSTLETLSEGFKGERPLSEWYRPHNVIQTVELNVDLAHKLLTKSEYELTLVAQLGHNCSGAVSILDDVLVDISANCNTSSENSSDVTLILKVLTGIREAFDKAHESVEHQKQSYDILLQHVSTNLGKWYLPWNEMALDATFYRDNYGSVDIFYPEIKVTTTREDCAYDIVAMMCDVGGSLGLCLGGSLLTVFEIVDFFFRKIFCCAP